VATYTPGLNYNGPDSFTFEASDGLQASAPSEVSITVTPVNDAPVASSGTATVAEDGTVAITLVGSDVDSGDPLTYISTSGPLQGTLNIAGAVATYSPAQNFHGADVFTFKVSDGQLDSPSAAITITVTPVNDAPVAVDDGSAGTPALTIDENSGPSAPINVLSNDSDVDGNPLAVTNANSPHGSVAINGDGTLVFTPGTGFSGPATIGYTISDGQGGTASATVFVQVDSLANLANWLEGFGLAGATPTEDSDGDSISNAVEYVIGGNPANQQDAALLPSVSLATVNLDGQPGSEDYLVFSYRRTKLADEDPTVTITVEWSASLAGSWSAADGSHGEVVQSADHGDHDLVQVFIPRSLAPNGKLFARLGVLVATP
jgi:hypothetical protein